MEEKVIAERYILQEKVGEGSYSVVYKGFDKDKNRKVAIKKMKSAGLTKEEADEAHELFFREINIMKDLCHDHIPRVYDFFLFEDRNYMVMQWIDGEDLLSIYKKQGRFQEWQSLSYMRQITDALIYLQNEKRSIIYKDLKPSNILVDKNGQIKIIDFGISRRYDPKKEKDTHILGTPGYAPPEAYTETQTDFSADVYSMGATFYHLTTGQEPFRFRFNFPDPREFNKDLSEDFAKLLTDCLKKRGERIPDARELKKRIMKVSGEVENEDLTVEAERAPSYPIMYLYFPFALIALFFVTFFDHTVGLYPLLSLIFLFLLLVAYPIYIIYSIKTSKFDYFSLLLSVSIYILFLFFLIFAFFHPLRHFPCGKLQ